jgi:hypothetical protein
MRHFMEVGKESAEQRATRSTHGPDVHFQVAGGGAALGFTSQCKGIFSADVFPPDNSMSLVLSKEDTFAGREGEFQTFGRSP